MNTMRIKHSEKFGLLLFSFIFLLFLPERMYALTTSPVIIELEAGPGQSLSRSVRIYNEQEMPVLVAPEFMGFTQNEDGNVELIRLDYDNPVKKWLAYNSDTIKLNPGAWFDWQFEIAVPHNAEPRTHNIALLFGSVPSNYNEELDRPVSIVSKTGPLIFLTVSGGPTGKGEIVELSALGKSLFSRFRIFDHLPQEFSVQVKNISDTAILPRGHLVIVGLLGRIKNAFSINSDERLVLPGWMRSFELVREAAKATEGFMREWQNFGFGPYKTALTMELGDNLVQKEYKFWVLPWRTLSLALLLLVGTIGIRRGRNKRGAL